MGKCNFKRMLTLLLALATVAVLCPAAPTVQAEDTDLCPCGCGKAIGSIKWTTYNSLNNSWYLVDFSKAGHYRITGDFTMKKEFTITGNVTIDFNGNTLTAASGMRGFTVKEGGTLTLMDGGEKGSLEGQNTADNGGAVYVEAGGTLKMSGGTVEGAATTGMGGAIYNAGSVTITGGSVVNDEPIYNHGGNIYNEGTLDITGGSVEAGVVKGNDHWGGNIYNAGTLNMKGGTVLEGSSWDHGGNLYLAAGSTTNIHGGVVENGKSTNKYAGNIYVTGGDTALNIYGGLITGGTAPMNNGGNLWLTGGAQVYMYGGTIENGSAVNGHNVYVSGSATTLYILGGTITAAKTDGDLYKSGNSTITMYGCRYNGSQNITDFMADCCCYNTDGTGITVWNSGYFYGCSDDCIFNQAMEDKLVELVTGSHTYVQEGTTYTCSVCYYNFRADSIAASVNGHLCETFEEAVNDFAKKGAGSVVQLQQDARVDADLAVSGYTLDLNGRTLEATEGFTSATGGNVIDTSVNSKGKLVCGDVTLAENNTYLPITMNDGLHFAEVGFTQWIEPLEKNTTKVKFYFTQRAKDTIIDDVINGGSSQINVQIHLAWKNENNETKSMDVRFSPELLRDYAQKWDNRVFVVTITGVENVSDLTCTWQVTSTAVEPSTTTSAQPIKSAGYINEKLSWETINSYPIKTTDMTVDEMRQLCLDFMVFGKTYLWTPDTSVSYLSNKGGTKDKMSEGTIYGGLPYITYGTGNPYRMMDYINPVTGLLDMHKALPALGTKDLLTLEDMRYFGSQCSFSTYWAWGRVINSVDYRWTSYMVPMNGFVILSRSTNNLESLENWNNEDSYGTDNYVKEVGEQEMYEAYAQLKKADGLVTQTQSSGHTVMVYEDEDSRVTVSYDDDGKIDGENSFVYIIDQAQEWEEDTNTFGDTYQRKNRVDYQRSFRYLYREGYVPFTFKEFLGEDDIEVTKVSLKDTNSETVYSDGTVNERTSFTGTQSVNHLTWSELFSSKITSNYGIADAYITFTDNNGNEIYRHAVRVRDSGRTTLDLVETGKMVTTWETGELISGETYNVSIEVQLATGERPVIWRGTVER